MSNYRDFRLSADTSTDTEKQLFDMLREKSTEEKLRMVSKMTATTRALAMAGLRERYPTESDERLRLRLVEVLYGPEIALQVSKELQERNK